MFVLRKENKAKPYSADLEEAVGFVGRAGDVFRCMHCNTKGFSAQAPRIRAHIAGAEGHNIAVCVPPPKATSETPEAYRARRVAFETARARMKVLMDEAAAAAAEAARKRELDRRTSSAHDMVQLPLWRARNASAAQQAADEALALAFITAGWAPNAVENPFVVEALNAVRARALRCPRTRPAAPALALPPAFCGALSFRFVPRVGAVRYGGLMTKTRLPALRRSLLSGPSTSLRGARR